MSKSKVRALASFRLCAHDLEVETLKWRRVQGVSPAVLRDQRLCGLCWNGVGDEMHNPYCIRLQSVMVTLPSGSATHTCLMS